MMMAPGDATLPGLGHAPISTRSSAPWYRFDIDPAAHPTGVSVRSLIREADGPRRKQKIAPSAAAAAAGDGSRKALPPTAPKTAAPATCDGTAAVAVTENGGATATAAAAAVPTAATITTTAAASSGSGVAAAAAGRDGGAATPTETAAPVNTDREETSTAGDGGAVTAAAVAAGTATAASGEEGGSGGGAVAVAGSVPEGAVTPAASSTTAATTTNVITQAASPMDVVKGPELAEHQPEVGGPQNRGRSWMSLIERLELEHGGGASDMYPTSSESGSEESEDGSGDENSGGGAEGGEGAEGDGDGTGGAGGAGKKKTKKVAKKVARRHSFDYEDDFIDDSELEKRYFAKEASKEAKTVHSGFFANQGSVATVALTNGSEEQDGSGGGSKGKGSGGAEGGGGSGGATGADGELIVKKKKKPKAASTNEAGKGGTPNIAKKKRKTSSEGPGGSKKISKVAGQAGRPDSDNTAPSPGGTQLGGVNASGPSANGAGVAGAAAAAGLGGAAAAAAAAASGANGVGATLVDGSAAAAAAQTGVGASPGQAAAGTGEGESGEAGAEGSGGEGGGKGGAGEKGGKNGAKPAAAWDPQVEAALARFEEESKAWVEGGRVAGDPTKRALEGMRTLDSFVRRSGSDAHSSRPYLLRVAAVYGRPPLEVKTILGSMKEEEHREECARLNGDFIALKSVFVSEVAASVGQLALSGQPLTPPFSWSNSLREHLHDMLRAFEAWSVKEHGGPRTKQALSETKALYDTLAQEWPAELTMTADCLKKMFQNEKRRIKAKANKEAAAEAAPPALPTGSASPPPAGAPSLDANRELSAGGTTAVAMPPPLPLPQSPSTPTSPSQQGAPGGGAATSAAGVGSPVATSQQPISLISPMAPQLQRAPTTPDALMRVMVATPTSAASTTASTVPSTAQQPPSPPPVDTASRPKPADDLSSEETWKMQLSTAMASELRPLRGKNFDEPPPFDLQDFEEEIPEDELVVEQ